MSESSIPMLTLEPNATAAAEAVKEETAQENIIPEKLELPLYLYIYECIKNDIRKGNIKANEKLPSKRNLAKQLEVSLITIENAYSQLLIEGYITAIEKKGYFVNEVEIIKSSNKKSTPNKSKELKEDEYFI